MVSTALARLTRTTWKLLRQFSEAAEATRSPVIVALSEGAIKYGGRPLIDMVIYEAKIADIPVAVHLDHGSSYESCMKCIRWGFSSVMIDKSHEDEETNTHEVKRVVEAAHAVGVTVEAEIGRLGGVEEHVVVAEEDAILTKADEAERFMTNTGADYLAVAIGTSHGANKGKGRPLYSPRAYSGNCWARSQTPCHARCVGRTTGRRGAAQCSRW